MITMVTMVIDRRPCAKAGYTLTRCWPKTSEKAGCMSHNPEVVGAKVVTHSRYVFFQMAEVAIPRGLFRAILERIRRLRPPSVVFR